MPGISIHVVDVARGLVATGMRIEVFACASQRELLCAGEINDRGLLDDAALNKRFTLGYLKVLFHIAEYYRTAGVAVPAVPFLDVVNYTFGISDPEQHYHLPFKVTPWGYSCFRGGA